MKDNPTTLIRPQSSGIVQPRSVHAAQCIPVQFADAGNDGRLFISIAGNSVSAGNIGNAEITKVELYDAEPGGAKLAATVADVTMKAGETKTATVAYTDATKGALSAESSNEDAVEAVIDKDDNVTLNAKAPGVSTVTIKNDNESIGDFQVTVNPAEGAKKPWAALDLTCTGYYPRALTQDGEGKMFDPITGSLTTMFAGFEDTNGGTELPANQKRSILLDKTDKDKDGSGTYTVELGNCEGATDIFYMAVVIGNVSEMLNADNDDYNVVITDAKLYINGKEVKTGASLDDLVVIEGGNLTLEYRKPADWSGEDRLYDAATGEPLVCAIEKGQSIKVQFTIDFHYNGDSTDDPNKDKDKDKTPTPVVPAKVATTSVTAPSSVTLAQGEKATVDVAAAPANNTDTMSVKSSDTKVVTATLSGKKVTLKGVKAGKSANVTVTSGAKSATIKVKVTKAPKKVKANKKSITIKKGKKATVKVTLYSAKKMTKKNKTSVYQLTAKVAKKKIATATVKGSKVTIKGKKKGSTKVTISTFNKKKAVVKVKVK